MFRSFKSYQLKKLLQNPDTVIGKTTLILLIIVISVFAFTIWWLNNNSSLGNVWKGFHAGNEITGTFCEKTEVNKPVRQPVNTFSNIIYLLIGIVILKEKKGRINTTPYKIRWFFELSFALVLLYVFFASTFYHASLTKTALKMDYSAVYFFSLFPVLYFSCLSVINKNRQLPHTSKIKLAGVVYLVYIVIGLLLSFFTPTGKEHAVAFINILIFFVFAFATILAIPKTNNLKYLALNMNCVAVALVWFEFDKYKILCNPNSYFQPHSLWNFFIGLSGFYFYVYMKSERKAAETYIKMHSI